MGKKLFSLCMALVLCLSLLPATALAAETAGEPQAVPSQTRTVGIWNFNDEDTSDSSGNGKNLTREGAISFKDGCMITQEGQVGNAWVDLELIGGPGFSLSMDFSTIRVAGTGAGAQTELFTLGSLSAVAYTTGELEVSLSGQSVGSLVGAVSDGGTNKLEVQIETDNALHVILNDEDIGYIANANVSGRKQLVIGNWSNSGYATSFDCVSITDTQPQPTKYTVTFNGNGGSGTMADQSFEYGEEKALAANSFTRTGHDFTGWNTKADGSGTSYTDKQKVKKLTDTDGGTVILYAQWKPSTYAVALYPNEGTIVPGKDVTQYTYGTGAALPTAEDITRDGYAFKGWYEDSGFSGSPVTEITSADTGAKTYYAKWVKLWTVTVTAGDGGTVSGGGTFEENATVTVTAVPDSGCRFIRWMENGAQVSTDESYAFPLTGDRNLTAEFARNSSGGSTYTITTPETPGGTVTVSPSRASSGRTVTITATPDTGFALESLTILDSRGNEIALTDKGDGKYTFTMPASRVTVEASFTPAPLPFEDVAPGAWYESAVRYAYFHNIMEGMRETEFSPTTALTRAMAVQILYNLEGQPDLSDENLGYPYEDVDAQAWYGDAVYWARITGVATGYGDGTFQPGDSITRQEFAQMLYNYAKYKGYDLCVEGDLAQFPDSGSVADWAEAAMSWANGNQLINGHDDGTIDAAGIGTRAQAASILMKFDQNLVEN